MFIHLSIHLFIQNVSIAQRCIIICPEVLLVLHQLLCMHPLWLFTCASVLTCCTIGREVRGSNPSQCRHFCSIIPIIAKLIMMNTPTTHCHWEDETVIGRNRTIHQSSFAEPKKMKSLPF